MENLTKILQDILPKNKYLFFDTETTGVLPDGGDPVGNPEPYPRMVQLSWIFEDKEHDYIIRPDGYSIPSAAAKVHGITTEKAQTKGTDIKAVLPEFLSNLVFAKKIIAHNADFDIQIIISEISRTYGSNDALKIQNHLSKLEIVDTMLETVDFVGATFADGSSGKYPRLEELYYKLFSDKFPAHNSLEDVRALKRCFWELVRLKII